MSFPFSHLVDHDSHILIGRTYFGPTMSAPVEVIQYLVSVRRYEVRRTLPISTNDFIKYNRHVLSLRCTRRSLSLVFQFSVASRQNWLYFCSHFFGERIFEVGPYIQQALSFSHSFQVIFFSPPTSIPFVFFFLGFRIQGQRLPTDFRKPLLGGSPRFESIDRTIAFLREPLEQVYLFPDWASKRRWLRADSFLLSRGIKGEQPFWHLLQRPSGFMSERHVWRIKLTTLICWCTVTVPHYTSGVHLLRTLAHETH